MIDGLLHRLSRPARLAVLCAAALAFSACAGEDGADGVDGAPGAQGPAGTNGVDGAKGTDGADGTNGTNGTSGTNGTNGKDGVNGTNGTNGTNGQDGQPSTGVLSFAPVMAPSTDADKRKMIASPEALVDNLVVPLEYVTELRTGQTVGTTVFGRIVDKQGNTVKNIDGSEFVSPSNDFSSILQAGGKLYEITQFETQPGAMYISELAQDAEGKLSVSSTKPVDFSGVDGLWNPCAGSVSPWGSHLGSEEYPADARTFEGATTKLSDVTGPSNTNLLRYWGIDPLVDGTTQVVDAAKAVFNPYNYGFNIEIKLDNTGKPSVAKHYSMGRRALELAYVMPDQKTVYLTDDGANDSLQMFVAKTAGDLSEGRLYAARWFQTSPRGQGAGTADIYWIELGTSAKDSDVKALINSKTKFSQIFDAVAPVDPTLGTCPDTYLWVNVDSDKPGECLKLKTGMELAASRLESRRYASMLGATTEFRKLEGITYNERGHRLYIAFSEVNNGMEDNNATRDRGGPNHAGLKSNRCGAVYQFAVGKDSVIGSDYIAFNASALVEGIWLNTNPYPAGSPYAGKNECSVNSIANPDNVAFIPGYDTLLIGEDSGVEHQNDAVWAYNVSTGEMNRILTTPYGAETTGVYFYPDINGHAYIKAQAQHPYGESDQLLSTGDADKQSYTGYIGPLPKMVK